jgi:hypothetical protein
MKQLPALLALAIAVWSGGVQAQNTIYRCGPDGRELSQTPCKEPGRGQVLTNPAAAPDAEQRRQADDVARRDAALARQLESDRRRQEAHDARQAAGAAGIHGRGQAAEPAAASATAHGKQSKQAKAPHRPEGFTVATPKPKPAKVPKAPKAPKTEP